MGSNPCPSHSQWSGKVLPAGEGGLQLEVSICLPGLEQLQPFTWVLDSFPVGSKMAFVSTHTCDVHQAAQLWMEVLQIHMHAYVCMWTCCFGQKSQQPQRFYCNERLSRHLLEETGTLLVYLGTNSSLQH